LVVFEGWVRVSFVPVEEKVVLVFGTGLPKASFRVTVIEADALPSAVTDAGEATIVDLELLGAAAVTVTSKIPGSIPFEEAVRVTDCATE